MRQKTLSALCLILLLALSLLAVPAAAGESFDASAMRLARFEGDVQILDAEGVPRFVLENVRFASGETLLTGEDSLASVSLDDSKIVTLDQSTAVQFVQEEQHMLLNLLDGQVFIDVSEKLDENATFDIQTTTLTIGIRGTLIFTSVTPPEIPGDNPVTTVGVLEGVGRLDYTDTQGTHRIQEISAGQIATLEDTPGGQGPSLAVQQMTAADIQGFVQEVVSADETLVERVTEATPEGAQLLLPPEDADLLPAGRVNLYPAGGSWTWSDPVQVVAQSASKLYDGQPLRRPDGALVSGLPESCSIAVTCSGTQTDAGSSANTVDSISIYNIDGEDITGHFTSIEKVEGTLRVDPAPLTVWTGSAEKVYDGEPLTCEEAEIKTIPGYVSEEPVWRNTSIVSRTALGAETMVGVSGTVWVHGSNPLTGEEREIELKTGQRLVVSLSDKDGEESISFTVETLTVQDLPEDVLRLYADNPDLLALACEDVPEWDPAELQARVDGMETTGSTVTQNGLNVHPDMEGDLMTDSSNVRITMDSGVTSYTTQVLTGTVAHFVPVSLDPSIRITATGEQEAVGESDNSYEIDWGSANPDNYTVTEDLGTLKVLPLDLELDCGIGKGPAAYDGKALIPWPSIVYRNGPHAGERIYSTQTTGALPARSVSDTRIRAASHTYHFRLFTGDTIDLVISGFGTKPGVYTLTASVTSSSPNLGPVSLSFPGATVVIEPAVLTITTGSAEKVYDGEALTCDEVTVSGLAESDPVIVKAAGRQSDVGSSPNTYTIDWGGVDPACYKIEENLGTLTVKAKNPLAISSPAREKIYDGSALAVTDKEIEVTGLLDGDKISVSLKNAEITNVGSVTPSFRIDWGKVDPKKYDVTETPGTLTVHPAPLKVTTPDDSKTYDGLKPLPQTTEEPTLTGLVNGEVAKIALLPDQMMDAGTKENEYSITWVTAKESNYTIAEENLGTLRIDPLKVKLCVYGDDMPYDGGTHYGNLTVFCENGSWAVDTLAGGQWSVTHPTGAEILVTASGAIDTGAYTPEVSYSFSAGKAGNYEVTTEAVPGEIHPCKVTVTVTGSTDSRIYNGSEQTLEGYSVSISDPLYKEADFTFSGNAAVKGTDASTYPLELEASQFTNTNSHFDVTFEVFNGALTIVPRDVTVTIKGTTHSATYVGSEFMVSGYSASISDPLYTRDFFSYSESTLVKATNAGYHPMGLDANKFTNSNNNFNVTFDVTDGYIQISPQPVTVTVTGKTATKTYTGSTQEITGYTTSCSLSWYNLSNVQFSGSARAAGETVGTWPMELAESQFTNSDGNFNVTFVVNNGALTITPAELQIVREDLTTTMIVNGTAVSAGDPVYAEYPFELPTGDTATLSITVINDFLADPVFSEYGVLTIQNKQTSEDRRFCYTISSPDLEIR